MIGAAESVALLLCLTTIPLQAQTFSTAAISAPESPTTAFFDWTQYPGILEINNSGYAWAQTGTYEVSNNGGSALVQAFGVYKAPSGHYFAQEVYVYSSSSSGTTRSYKYNVDLNSAGGQGADLIPLANDDNGQDDGLGTAQVTYGAGGTPVGAVCPNYQIVDIA